MMVSIFQDADAGRIQKEEVQAMSRGSVEKNHRYPRIKKLLKIKYCKNIANKIYLN